MKVAPASKLILHDTIQEHAEEVVPEDGPLLVNWVIVAEWAAPSGEHHLTAVKSDDLSWWQYDGLLNGALKMEDDEDEP